MLCHKFSTCGRKLTFRLDVINDKVVYRRIGESELRSVSEQLYPGIEYEDFLIEHVPLFNIEQTIKEKNIAAKQKLEQKIKQLDEQAEKQINLMYETQRINRELYERKHGTLDYPPIERRHNEYPAAYVTVEDMNVKPKPRPRPPSPVDNIEPNFFENINYSFNSDPFNNSSFFDGDDNFDDDLVLTEKTAARKLLHRHDINTKKQWKIWSMKNHPDKNPTQQNIELVAEINAAISLLADEIS